jgi:hypothetical protein
MMFVFPFPAQAAKGRDVEFDGVSDLPASDNESMNTADKPSLDRQGSIQVSAVVSRCLCGTEEDGSD